MTKIIEGKSDSPQGDLEKKPSNKPKQASVLFFPLIVSLGLAFFSILLSATALYQIHHHHSVLADNQADFINKLNELQQLQNQQKQQIDTFNNILSASESKSNKAIKIIDEALQNTLKQKNYVKEDWLLLKARYYLELAQINAHWTENKETTIDLLEAANGLLANFKNQTILDIRQKIADEIVQIKSTPQIDRAGLLSSIDANANLVIDLPIKPLAQDEEQQTYEQQKSTSWKSELKRSLHNLSRLVVIRKKDNSQILIFPIYQSLLRQSIRMNLQAAQWAILEMNAEIYKNSLEQALKTIRQNFDMGSSITLSLINELTRLQQVQIISKNIPINQSLDLLDSYINQTNNPSTPLDAGVKQ